MVESPLDTTFRVGEVVDAEAFPETTKPEMAKLRIDLGDERVRSVARTGYNYDPDDLVGRQVLCATDLGTVRIAGFESEVLTVGVFTSEASNGSKELRSFGVPDGDGHPVLVAPDEDVPLGGKLY